MSPIGRCHVCGAEGRLEWVTVRVYQKRRQFDYRYHPCADCRRVLASFLEGNTLGMTSGLFHHRAGAAGAPA